MFYNVVIHLESMRRKTEEISEELGLKKASDELLAFEVIMTMIRESIHCVIRDAFMTPENIKKLRPGYF